MAYSKALLSVAEAVSSEDVKPMVGLVTINVGGEPATFRATESGHGFGVQFSTSEMHYFSYSELDDARHYLAHRRGE